MCAAAWKIHVSPQTKEILDVFGSFTLQHRGLVAMKVHIILFYHTIIFHTYTGWPKKVSYRTLSISSLNIERFSQFFHQ